MLNNDRDIWDEGLVDVRTVGMPTTELTTLEARVAFVADARLNLLTARIYKHKDWPNIVAEAMTPANYDTRLQLWIDRDPKLPRIEVGLLLRTKRQRLDIYIEKRISREAEARAQETAKPSRRKTNKLHFITGILCYRQWLSARFWYLYRHMRPLYIFASWTPKGKKKIMWDISWSS